MKAVQSETGQLDTNELLRIISQLKAPDLEGFINKLLKILEKKKSPEFKSREEFLIEKIKKGGPLESVYLRNEELAIKLFNETMTPAENKEAIEISTVIEKWGVERLKLVVELSSLWDTTIDDVFERLSLKPRPLNYA